MTHERLNEIMRRTLRADVPAEVFRMCYQLIREVRRLQECENDPCFCCRTNGCQGGCRCWEKAEPEEFAASHADE